MLKLITRCLVVSAVAAALLFVSHPGLSHAENDGQVLGGKLVTTGTLTFTNPCNSVTFTVPVDTVATVGAIVANNDFVQVAVFDSFTGTEESHGTEYHIQGSSSALYNTLTGTFYSLPMLVTANASNPSLNFTVLTNTEVLIDSINSQKPTQVDAFGEGIMTCKGS